MPKLLVLGDDLTGTNTTGARYARFGLRAVSVNAPLEPDAPCFRAESGIDALVINLSTRHAPPAHAERVSRRLRDRHRSPAPRPSVVTVACLEHLNHVPATGRKNP